MDGDKIAKDGLGEPPVCVSDERKRDTEIPLLVSIFIFGAAAISVYKFGDSSVTFIQVVALVILGLVFLAFAGYTYLTSRRAEFYEEFVRIISRRGQPRDVPYSQLLFKLRQVRGRTGIIEVGRLFVKDDGKRLLTMSDIKIEKLDTTLFQWLPKKTGGAPTVKK